MGFACDTVTQERGLGALCQKWGDKDQVYFLLYPSSHVTAVPVSSLENSSDFVNQLTLLLQRRNIC